MRRSTARRKPRRRRPGSTATLKWSRLFNDAILNALKHNPRHPKARKLLVEMGGKIR